MPCLWSSTRTFRQGRGTDRFRHFYGRNDLAFQPGQSREALEVQVSVTKEFAGFSTTAVNIEGDVKLMLEGGTFMMFRYSDTEPVMRVYVEP